ncbi:hypothetical protein DFJ63DRAFT_311360 [Scheffersomyces coipomensis]|uniref:uncharacterized protein n=1 Tax=Scheffersomyces coipomensis TaxID=1788519 RepID=UPI00315C5291
MVTINYEPLEHLPYLDASISPEERAHVEQLIRIELTNQFANQNLNNINFHPPQPQQPTQPSQPSQLQPQPQPPQVQVQVQPQSQPIEQSILSPSLEASSQRDVTPTIIVTQNDIPNRPLIINNNSSHSSITQTGLDDIHNHHSTTPLNSSSTNEIISPLNDQQQQQPPLHPLVDHLLPLSTTMHRLSPSPLINEEIERYELEFEDEDFDEDIEGEDDFHIIKNGIDLSRYNVSEGSSSSSNNSGSNQIPSVSELYTSLSYQQLTERNLRILLENNEDLSQFNNDQLQNLQSLQQDYVINVNSKRVKLDDINQIRKRKQMEFGTVNNYLQTKWKDGIKNVVELGIESSRIEENL